MYQLNRGSMKRNTKISRCYVITRRIDVTQQTKCRNMNSVLRIEPFRDFLGVRDASARSSLIFAFRITTREGRKRKP